MASGAHYPGHFDLRTFIGLVDRCDVVVSAVTMAMHLAIGLRQAAGAAEQHLQPP